MHSAADELRAAQTDLGRPLRFDEYMELALYGRAGFYQRGGSAGRRGDFITSPEVGPLFGVVLARWIDAEHERLGRPDQFTVVEVGAGPGTLARSITNAAPHLAVKYVAVERSVAQRERHPDTVHSTAEMPTGIVGVVIANELLDNLPFRLAVFDGGWREAYVEVGSDGTASERLVPAPDDWSWLPGGAAHGARVPVQADAAGWVRQALASLVEGAVLVFDYTAPSTAVLARRPWREWLRTYREHQPGVHYLRAVGEQDITCDVCLDQLPEPYAVRTQTQFLQRWGIGELVEEGRAAWEAAAGHPDLAAIRMRSRIREADALLDPTGLGRFSAIEWRSGE